VLAQNYLQNPATEDLDMGTGLKITLEQNVAHPKRWQIIPGSTRLEFWDALYAKYADLKCYAVWVAKFAPDVSSFYFDLYNSTGSFCIFRARKGNTLTEVARLQSTVVGSDPYFDIKALACSTLPTSDPADGLSRIWSDSGVLTLGT